MTTSGYSETHPSSHAELVSASCSKNRSALKNKNPLNAGKSPPSIGSKTGSRNKFGMTIGGTSEKS